MPNDTHNTKRVDSPFPLWPGYILLPAEISPQAFMAYWEKANTPKAEGDNRPDLFLAWYNQWHIVLDWKLEGVKSTDIDETALKLPSAKLIAWVVRETTAVLRQTWTLPNSPAPLNGSEVQTAQLHGPGISPNGVTTSQPATLAES